jgi:hypothetical protein
VIADDNVVKNPNESYQIDRNSIISRPCNILTTYIVRDCLAGGGFRKANVESAFKLSRFKEPKRTTPRDRAQGYRIRIGLTVGNTILLDS